MISYPNIFGFPTSICYGKVHWYVEGYPYTEVICSVSFTYLWYGSTLCIHDCAVCSLKCYIVQLGRSLYSRWVMQCSYIYIYTNSSSGIMSIWFTGFPPKEGLMWEVMSSGHYTWLSHSPHHKGPDSPLLCKLGSQSSWWGHCPHLPVSCSRCMRGGISL